MTTTRPERTIVRIQVTSDTTRAELAEAIGHLRASRDRLPIHWVDRRDDITDEIDALVAEWLAFQ
jgi:hypothetical protein